MELDEKYYAELGREFNRLIEIIYRLREPDGCPWDRAQTHKSIRENVIEEAYELVEAVDLNDPEKMKEECGDVLLQAVFNAVMSEELGEFSVRDMIKHLNEKLIFRHTHIFGGDKANNESEALGFWEKAKMREKGQRDVCDRLDSIPATFPALMRAAKAQKIGKKTLGIDFEIKEAVANLEDEVGALRAAVETGALIENDCGSLLFEAVNVVRSSGVDPEIALLESTKIYEEQLRKTNELILADGRNPDTIHTKEKLLYFNKAKAKI